MNTTNYRIDTGAIHDRIQARVKERAEAEAKAQNERPRPLTRRQREVLSFLETHIGTKGYAPSFEEIARQFAFRSLATVYEHLENLAYKGHIRRTFKGSRAIELVATPAHCPHCGAGLP